MSLLGEIQELSLNQPLASSSPADLEDVTAVKARLKRDGYYEEPSYGMTPYTDTPLFEGIKRFQRDNGLTVDGVMKPDGETERAMNRTLDGWNKKWWDSDAVMAETLDPHKWGINPDAESPLSPSPLSSSSIKLTLNDKDKDKGTDAPPTNLLTAAVKEVEKEVDLKNDGPPLTTQQRKKVILEDKAAIFKVSQNPEADDSEPWYSIDGFSEVKGNEKTIEQEAQKAAVNPDMVKAIVYLETTQGWYDRFFSPFGLNETIRPMNVHASYWKDLGYSREDLEGSQKNIQAGIKLLKRIQDRMPDASVDEVATVYNSLGARKVTDYGARVKRLMEEKPWEKENE